MSVTDSRMFQETHIVRKNINLSHRYPRKPSARICPSQDRNQEGFLKEMTFQVKHADRDKPSHLPTLPRAGLRGLITVPTLPPVPKAPGPPDSHGLGTWGAGRMEHPEKTHLDVGRMCKFCTVVPARGIFFPHKHYNKVTLNKKMLFEDLLSLKKLSYSDESGWLHLESPNILM